LNDLFILCRFLHFAAAMAMFGTSVFLGTLAPPSLAEDLAASMRRLEWTAWTVLAVSGLGWLLLEAGEMGEGWQDAVDPQVLSSVIVDTTFGHVWVWRLAGVIALAAVLGGRPSRYRTVAALSALLLGSLALVGHASMRVGFVGALERANQAIHLVCGGFWLGALPPLLTCLTRLHEGSPFRREAATALRRFSGVGHGAVAGVVATGAVNVAIILRRPPTDLASPYQALLFAKILVVALMIASAVGNRYWLVPRMAVSPGPSRRWLARMTTAEIVLGGVVLALVSIFATFEPS
jgi:copper resistance protein D